MATSSYKSRGVRSDCVINTPAVVPTRIPAIKGTLAPQQPQTAPKSSSSSRRHPTFIGIGGGRGAGKEVTCRYVIDKVRERGYTELADRVVHLHLDDFHKELDEGDRELVEAGKTEINFDHPEAFDFELLADVLERLRNGEPADVPQWDVAKKQRIGTQQVDCQPRVVLVEGILVLFVKHIREFLDMQVFVDVDSDTRLGRQIRAMLQTGIADPEVEDKPHGGLKGFLHSYLYMAKPSFEEFVWPTKRWADVIIPRGDANNVAIDLIAQRLIDLGEIDNS